MKRSQWVKTAAALVVGGGILLSPALPAHGQDAKLNNRPNQVTGQEINEAQKRAVQKGLLWLKKHQGPNGGFGANGGYGGGSGGHAGITALAGLAFMSDGNLPGRGDYGEQVQKCLDFVAKSCQAIGLIASDQTHGPMYGHGFATLFLGEIYGMTGDESIREKLQNAVKLIQKTQNPDGGWRYQPVPFDADISVTICEVMGLRAANDAGIKVEPETIKKAIDYIKKCQCSDGGFSYQANQGSGSGFARTGAGVAALYYLGVFEGKNITDGLKYLKERIPRAGAGPGGGEGMMDGYFYYGNYYATQAMFLAGGDYWAQWYPAIRDELIKRQTPDGNWSGGEGGGDDYATAMALIILQMPNRYLPVFNGKGPGG